MNLETERLLLRPFDIEDATYVQKLADDKELAETTFLPHPYSLEAAQDWILGHSDLIEKKDAFPFAEIL